MSPKKFRAFYKGDFETPDGALKFEQKVIRDELWFAYDEILRYPFEFPFLDDDWIINQWTGLLDKNGKEIYEYDIVHSPKMDYNMICKWDVRGCWVFRLHDDDKSFHLYSNEDTFEIVGNLYENPELI